MNFRINTNSVKNAMGTMFLLAAAFFVCSTLVSMRSVFADPIVNPNATAQKSGRTSPRAVATTTNRATVSRATTARATNTPTRTAVSRGNAANRTVTSRGITPTRTTRPTTTRGVTSRSNATTNRTTNNRAIRARSGATASRVSATGSVMTGSRASSATSYTYLSSKLYTGSYSNIIDSTTGLISADAYSNCLESYYTCMDEICTARNDTKGRCSCAGRATNFLQAEEQLEKANEELIKLSGQLSLLIATKGKGDDLTYAFSLTEAEQVMNCVSWKETISKYGKSSDEAIEWCSSHNIYDNNGGKVTSCTQPEYCGKDKNSYGFDINDINGSSSDILAQLKAWADAKDLAKEYTSDNENDLWGKFTTIAGVVNGLSGLTSDVDADKVSLDSLANKWGYDLFQYAHNNVCGRVLDSCFNGIYEACGTPKTITEGGKTLRMKCANGATSNCPFNYNSFISVDPETGDVVLSDRSTSSASVTSSASCFGYSTTSTATGARVSASSASSDPYYTLRGPVADARRSIMQKYLLDSNAACDTYGASLKKTAQNINYQKIAAEQALQQKRLEFKQEIDATTLAEATTAIENFNECISELWDCYDNYAEEEKWTTARIKAYCSQVSQVPHCYETMICSPLQTQLTAIIDLPDSESCFYSTDYSKNTCRNVVTINEILYGAAGQETATSAKEYDILFKGLEGKASVDGVHSAVIRAQCLNRALNCNVDSTDNKSEGYCIRNWTKNYTKDNEYQKSCTDEELQAVHATAGYKSKDATECQYITSCDTGYTLSGNVCVTDSISCSSSELANMNAISGKKTWDTNKKDWGDCKATVCKTGYELARGMCWSIN